MLEVQKMWAHYMSKTIYIIGSLRNPEVPVLANTIQEQTNYEAFCSWFSPGPNADDYWREYCELRGWSFKQALKEYAATHVYEFDKHHIDRADIGVLVMPAGKSGHLELGYMIGQGKPCFYLLDKDSERWDVMLQFCYLNGGSVCENVDDLIYELTKL